MKRQLKEIRDIEVQQKSLLPEKIGNRAIDQNLLGEKLSQAKS